ncbi:uncharacterized protein SETTUDRAFT_168354 [Exserohilum turcica Et28A]|uniref:Uncharacterized protein n=1 Tax=Exserohilum turcicum (strain 28A) TaxID=671987 RepID=R0KGR4_EXST2|nr:uncharacterized protein SETTUDRAFT_168354 [Exserohilum turcica Et28A]EOA88464.1 hypothetical protein SETTUDRAFT_168354 [Exserohilum turcica Et28A]
MLPTGVAEEKQLGLGDITPPKAMECDGGPKGAVCRARLWLCDNGPDAASRRRGSMQSK